ncbi:ATP-dependent sacrificial sulfur transferase LarE [Anaerotruncus colihominis]|uniref:ATP-dependent sacrificial sulfur transferase LarE n=1 Tax=Anaerotruncus colihominis TaxID=169435 RepID=A0A845RG82_9FIRM|nr:ATP-dependent sacrificial sulfur transferase LarE [Anaerotruncus colihominis]MCR2025826.1 ATP-dependent sacrificial sulfur transferase LarE [Anaerotruncus colihominis]NBI77845.1 ATP-dependent sacrificial sulfur transferase LarE [Anaerotruncus colihominis]NDO38623.1 ATP-dependent sacrificial sulfur transferase LarE [Anaerotruncus colihominis]
MRLSDFFAEHPRLAVAFSGGVDSAYLLYAARTAGCDVHAYFIHSQFQPQFELDDTRRFVEMFHVPLTILDCDVLSDPAVCANDALRCYHCKRALFTRLWQAARTDGFKVLCDGTNASDEAADRPGMRALKELDVLSPLRVCGLTKADIRALSKQAGLFTHDKPAYACLATRIPMGTPVTQDALGRVERAENALFELGFTNLRVRVLDNSRAKLQVPAAQFTRIVELREQILLALSPDFEDISLDLRAR